MNFALSFRNRAVLAVALLLSFATTSFGYDPYYPFQYPPYGSNRGRMVHREGLFHSTRYRWGGGVTDNGAAVLTAGIGVIPTIIGGLTGRDFEPEPARRDAVTRAPITFPQDYIVQQTRANDLLERTARLVDPSFGAQSPQPGPQTGPATSIEELKRLYNVPPGNPWTN